MKRFAATLAIALAAAFVGTASFAQAPDAAGDVQAAVAASVSADAAHDAVVRGAFVVDIRSVADYAAGHVPGAVSAADLAGVDNPQVLQALVSRHGIDLLREVLIVGQAGDEGAMRLRARLAEYATGRVVWFVGGVNEWALSGRPVETQAAVLPPVPQYLVQLAPTAATPRMAGANLRDLPEARPLVASAL